MGRPSLWGDRVCRRGPIGQILWDHEADAVGPPSRFQGTNRGTRTKALVPRWSLV